MSLFGIKIGNSSSGSSGGGTPVTSSTLSVNRMPIATAAHALGDGPITYDSTNLNVDSGPGLTTIGDVNGAGNGTTLTVDDTGQLITLGNVDGTANISVDLQGIIRIGGIDPPPAGQIILSTSLGVHTDSLIPNFTPGVVLGQVALPFESLTIGEAANHTTQQSSAATANRTAVWPDRNLLGVVGTTTSVALTAQAASIGSTALQVNGGVAPAGLYRLTYYLVTSVAGSSGTLTATFGWTDLGAARTSTSATITFGTLATPATGTLVIQANGIANITYLTTVTAAVGSPKYDLNITLEAIQ